MALEELSGLRDQIKVEAARAREAVSALDDRLVAAALVETASRLGDLRPRILEVNEHDVRGASAVLDSGSLDRLTLTPARLDDMETQLRVMADLPPPER